MKSNFLLGALSVFVSILGLNILYSPSSFAATPVDACFQTSGSTITNYTVGGANNCPVNVDIPSTIGGITMTTVGQQAFYSKGLTAVTFPNTINVIDNFAFSLNNLSTVSIPSNITTIGQQAFNSNASLTTVNIAPTGGSLTIGDGAFNGDQIGVLDIPGRVVSIGMSAFFSNPISSLTLHEGLQTIGLQAFANFQGAGGYPDSTFTNLSIPNSVTSIGAQAFMFNHITSLTLGSGLTLVPLMTFAGNNIQSVTIPDNITLIDDSAFSYQSAGIPVNFIAGTATSSDYQQLYYTSIYTANPSNPNGLHDGIAVGQEQGTDLNGNGTTNDWVTMGGHLINPARVTVTYRDSTGTTLQPSITQTGSVMSDYLVVHDPNNYPAPADGSTYTIAEQSALDAQLATAYYHFGKTLQFTAPIIANYSIINPASPTSITLAHQSDALNFIYSNPPVVSTGQLAQTGTDAWMYAGAAVIVIAGAAAMLWRASKQLNRRVTR